MSFLIACFISSGLIIWGQDIIRPLWFVCTVSIFLSKAGIDCASTLLLQYDIDVPLYELQFPDMNSTLITAGRVLSDQLKMACSFISPYKPLPNGYFSLGFGGNGITFI